MGIAILEGRELLYYGVKTFKKSRPMDRLLQDTRRVLLRLIKSYQPTVLAVEKAFFAQSKSSALLLVQEREIKEVGKRQGLRVVGYAPKTVRKAVCGNGNATKREVASLIAAKYPELRIYLHQDRRWKEAYWFHVFDAVSAGLTYWEGQ